MSIRTLSTNRYQQFRYNATNSSLPFIGSVTFPGTNSNYIGVASTSAVGFSTGDYTVEAFIKPDNKGNSAQIVSGSAGRFTFAMGTTFGANNLGGLRLTSARSANLDYCSFSFTAGVWYHVAVTRQSGTVRFFVDGTQQTTLNTGSSGTDWGNESALFVGADPEGTETFDGSISSLRIVKSTALYTASFTAPTAPLTPVANTSLLTCQTDPVTDRSTNNWTVSEVGTVTVSGSVGPFS